MSNLFSKLLILFMITSGLIWCLEKIKNLYYKYKFNKKKCLIYKKKNIYKKISSFFPMLLLIWLFRSFLFEPFTIPSGSMIPSLLIGDFIIVKKFAYNIRNPFNNKILYKIKDAQRGDVIVFQYPKNRNVNYIKRIIGIPGDIIIYNSFNKTLTIKNILKNSTNNLEIIKYKKIKNINKKNEKYIYLKNIKIMEEKINNKKHKIFLNNNLIDKTNFYYKQKKYNRGTWIVPKGYYFVMGDNRDNSSDSRYWGLLPEENLIGKANFIWLSINKNKNIFPKIRLKRIGERI
ncbi:MAG: signal peptidase I [Buchnera aphidicola (Periphyllus aceris)]|nr:signal peptidase I [Buchnera aphidicola (Periphyllus aceris)]